MDEIILDNDTTLTRRVGRHRKNEEDKALPMTVKFHKEHREKLAFVRGDNPAQKFRYLIDSNCEYRQRELRQIEEIKKRLSPLAPLARKLYSPELKENKEQFKKVREAFLNGVQNFRVIVNLFHFEYATLKRNLTAEETVDLDVILFMEDSLNAS